ncbi:MAG: response regulator transcription factor [Nevskiaceae bacterium]|nr:MAG: response regulator transcription factor [Nevskiaceae bacterium]TBR71965.1 MAG: response regulator transcription factor [Nevskiaceae bacterium]
MNNESSSAIVYVVDDDESVREALCSLVGSAGLRVQVFSSATEFLRYPRSDAPACLVLDERMPGFSGTDLHCELIRAGDPIPVIFITGHGDIPMAVRATKRGAIEVLVKPFTDESLLGAISEALATNLQEPEERKEAAESIRRYDSLTAREREVLPFIDDGLLNKQIAAELGISEATVKVHRHNIMHKMGTKSVPELVRMWEKIRHKMVR